MSFQGGGAEPPRHGPACGYVILLIPKYEVVGISSSLAGDFHPKHGLKLSANSVSPPDSHGLTALIYTRCLLTHKYVLSLRVGKHSVMNPFSERYNFAGSSLGKKSAGNISTARFCKVCWLLPISISTFYLTPES